MTLQTLDGDDSSSSSIPSTKNGDLLATGASAGALSTNLRRETDRPGNQASLVGTKLSTESRGQDGTLPFYPDVPTTHFLASQRGSSLNMRR